MNVDNCSKASFGTGARIKYCNPKDFHDKSFRPLINYLKHHCGGKNVEHVLDYRPDFGDVFVATSLYKNEKLNKDCYGIYKGVSVPWGEKTLTQLLEINSRLKSIKQFEKDFNKLTIEL